MDSIHGSYGLLGSHEHEFGWVLTVALFSVSSVRKRGICEYLSQSSTVLPVTCWLEATGSISVRLVHSFTLFAKGKTLDLFEEVQRGLTYSYITVGGLTADLPPGWLTM